MASIRVSLKRKRNPWVDNILGRVYIFLPKALPWKNLHGRGDVCNIQRKPFLQLCSIAFSPVVTTPPAQIQKSPKRKKPQKPNLDFITGHEVACVWVFCASKFEFLRRFFVIPESSRPRMKHGCRCRPVAPHHEYWTTRQWKWWWFWQRWRKWGGRRRKEGHEQEKDGCNRDPTVMAEGEEWDHFWRGN